ncbi:MAG: hypothetical protein PHG49_04065 [Candidatus Pacebacteria bacterium]|nr:hypothetical protein [Candidatus Paceibacterota bacterium]
MKTEANPDGILEDLSKMKLVLNYGVRYETYCGYWVHKGDFITFTPDTNTAPNQTIYYFNSNETLE